MVVVIDTNVFREGLHPKGNPVVKRWLRALPFEESTTTVVNIAEVRAGAAKEPYGRKRVELETFIETSIVERYGERILPFDLAATSVYAADYGELARTGRPIGSMDLMIAAICKVHGAALATRNIKDFRGLGIHLINPWDN